VLPEDCLNLMGPSRALGVVQEFAQQRWIVAGARLPAPDGEFYNSAIALAPGGDMVFQQQKSVPVPLMADGVPARERHLLHTPFGNIGIAICYDMGFTFVADDLVRQGADFLIYPTMDHSSWGDNQRRQHAAIAPLRAIENRRWVMRVASSGISCAIDPTGHVVARQEIDARGGLIAARLEQRSDQTLYARAGWTIPWICLWGTALVIAGVVVTDIGTKLRAAFGSRQVPAAEISSEFLATPGAEPALNAPPQLSANEATQSQEPSCLPP
jgi:apolipoprotein N-acyltransferase